MQLKSCQRTVKIAKNLNLNLFKILVAIDPIDVYCYVIVSLHIL